MVFRSIEESFRAQDVHIFVFWDKVLIKGYGGPRTASVRQTGRTVANLGERYVPLGPQRIRIAAGRQVDDSLHVATDGFSGRRR